MIEINLKIISFPKCDIPAIIRMIIREQYDFLIISREIKYRNEAHDVNSQLDY